MITVKELKKAFKRVKEILEEKKNELNKLDSEIGDSDHGQSVTKAFARVDKVAEEYDGEDIGELLSKIAKSIISYGGAAMGPLYGTAFLKASKKVKGKKNIDLKDLKCILEAMEKGIKERGKVKVGDKTMLDTLHPAAKALAESDNIEEGIKSSIKAAEEGMKKTKEMKAKVGRSSRLGDRSIGYIDPGSASMYYILREFLQTLDN